MTLSVVYSPPSMSVAFAPAAAVIDIGTPVAREEVERDPYEGDYVVTPGAATIVLATKDKRMTDHVTINPVPSNYGLITWNGSTITVS